MIHFTTIPDGERVALWNKLGQVQYISGPRRLCLWPGQRIDHLERHSAGASQYLVIRFRDGHAEHLRGPAAVYFHPIEHASIEMHDAIPLDANEALVVYTRHDDHISRRIVRGPELFVPAANEWLHEFSWHGSTPAQPNRKFPHALKFTKLRVIPDQMYFDVEEVRTADDALIVIRLMIFFELADIEVMLSQTHDPTADFINAVTADVIDFAATLPFEKFKEQTDRLNALETYPQLTQRAARIGYRINKVVYRGYHANAKLQTMHDSAIEARTRLKLEAETERQAQELADLKLAREADRIVRRQDMERTEAEHKQRMERLNHEQKLRLLESETQQKIKLRQAEIDQELGAKKAENQIDLEHRQAMAKDKVGYLQSMQQMQVDLTRYLVSKHQHPDRFIRLDAGREAQVHLHE